MLQKSQSTRPWWPCRPTQSAALHGQKRLEKAIPSYTTKVTKEGCKNTPLWRLALVNNVTMQNGDLQLYLKNCVALALTIPECVVFPCLARRRTTSLSSSALQLSVRKAMSPPSPWSLPICWCACHASCDMEDRDGSISTSKSRTMNPVLPGLFAQNQPSASSAVPFSQQLAEQLLLPLLLCSPWWNRSDQENSRGSAYFRRVCTWLFEGFVCVCHLGRRWQCVRQGEKPCSAANVSHQDKIAQ